MPNFKGRAVESCIPLLIAAKDEQDFHCFLFASGIGLGDCLFMRTPEQLQYYRGQEVLFTSALCRDPQYIAYKTFCDYYEIRVIKLVHDKVITDALDNCESEVDGE